MFIDIVFDAPTGMFHKKFITFIWVLMSACHWYCCIADILQR